MLWANTLFKTKNELRVKVTVASLALLAPMLLPFGTVFAKTAPVGGSSGDGATWTSATSLSYSGKQYSNPQTSNSSLVPKTTSYTSGSGQCTARITFDGDESAAHQAQNAKYTSSGTYVQVVGCTGQKTKSISVVPYKIQTPGTGDTTGDNGGDGSGSGKTEPQCDAGSWSFMVCPFITSTQEVLQKLFGMIADLSYFQPLPIGTPKKTADWSIYYGWATFLTFANIAAVIGFLIIIFSQATSMGLSSYGVKKLLPKMAMVMILMNVSYYLCAIAIDISNIIGAAINDVFNYIYTQVTNKLDPDLVNGGLGSGAIAGWFGGLAALAIIVAFFLVPVLITLLVIFGVLAARIAILTLLVIIAPLAFAAWILPNTEKYFHKWWSLFFDMLAIYPALMAIYGGATLAANILLLNSQNGDSTFNNILPFVALLVQVLPLLAIPFIIKATSGSLGKIANMVESKSRKPAEWVGGKAKSYGRFGAIAAGNKIGRKFGDPDNPGRFRRGVSKVGSGYRNARAFDKAVETSLEARKRGREEEIAERATELGAARKLDAQGRSIPTVGARALQDVGGSRYGEIVAAQVDKAFKERVQSIRADLELQIPPPDKYASRLKAAIEGGHREETTALIGYMATAGGAGGRQALEDTLANTAATSDEMKVAINNSIYRDNYGSLLGSRGSLAKGGLDASGKWQPKLAPVKIEALASQDEGALQAHFEQIDQKNAQSILSNEALASKISSKKARILFKARARGDALDKAAGLIQNSAGAQAVFGDTSKGQVAEKLYDPATGAEIDEDTFF